MLKRLWFTAILASGAVALLSPAAQANKSLQPLHEGVPFTGQRTVSLSGVAKFTGELGGIEATLDITATFVGGSSTGSVTAVTVTNPSAFGLITCTIEFSAAIGLPWTIHAEESTGIGAKRQFAITNPQFVNHLSGQPFCPDEFNIVSGTVLATPGDAGAISSVALSGAVVTTAGTATVSGNLGVSPAGTYGIG